MGKELDPASTDGAGLPNAVPLDLAVERHGVLTVLPVVVTLIITEVVVVHHRIIIVNWR